MKANNVHSFTISILNNDKEIVSTDFNSQEEAETLFDQFFANVYSSGDSTIVLYKNEVNDEGSIVSTEVKTLW